MIEVKGRHSGNVLTTGEYGEVDGDHITVHWYRLHVLNDIEELIHRRLFG